jgi:hypothetical protein
MQPTVPLPDDELPSPTDYSRLEHFRRRHIEPPTGEYVTLDDTILVEGFSALVTNTIQISIRILNPEGEIIPFFFTLPALAQGVTPTSLAIKNMEGFLLSMSITQAAGAKGAVFVRATLQRGAGSGDSTRGKVLISGYPSAVDALGYPWGTLVSSLDARGLANVIVPGDPGAGSDYIIAVSAGTNFILRALSFVLTTSAVAGNRIPILQIADNAAHIFARILLATAVPANTTQTLSVGAGLGLQLAGINTMAGLPFECRLAAGWRVTTNTTGLLAGDQYTGMALYGETFIGT